MVEILIRKYSGLINCEINKTFLLLIKKKEVGSTASDFEKVSDINGQGQVLWSCSTITLTELSLLGEGHRYLLSQTLKLLPLTMYIDALRCSNFFPREFRSASATWLNTLSRKKAPII